MKIVICEHPERRQDLDLQSDFRMRLKTKTKTQYSF